MTVMLIYMTVMLIKKKPLVVLAVIQKTRILKCLSSGLDGFLFGQDRLILSDWIG
jgi:hypothetical protein